MYRSYSDNKHLKMTNMQLRLASHYEYAKYDQTTANKYVTN